MNPIEEPYKEPGKLKTSIARAGMWLGSKTGKKTVFRFCALTLMALCTFAIPVAMFLIAVVVLPEGALGFFLFMFSAMGAVGALVHLISELPGTTYLYDWVHQKITYPFYAIHNFYQNSETEMIQYVSNISLEFAHYLRTRQKSPYKLSLEEMRVMIAEWQKLCADKRVMEKTLKEMSAYTGRDKEKEALITSIDFLDKKLKQYGAEDLQSSLSVLLQEATTVENLDFKTPEEYDQKAEEFAQAGMLCNTSKLTDDEKIFHQAAHRSREIAQHIRETKLSPELEEGIKVALAYNADIEFETQTLHLGSSTEQVRG